MEQSAAKSCRLAAAVRAAWASCSSWASCWAELRDVSTGAEAHWAVAREAPQQENLAQVAADRVDTVKDQTLGLPVLCLLCLLVATSSWGSGICVETFGFSAIDLLGNIVALHDTATVAGMSVHRDAVV